MILATMVESARNIFDHFKATIYCLIWNKMKEQEEQSITFQEGAVYLNLVRSKTETKRLKQKGMSHYDLLNHLLEWTEGSLLKYEIRTVEHQFEHGLAKLRWEIHCKCG